jgi:(p)ppGpp synthase/HD superfamily hydrolase
LKYKTALIIATTAHAGQVDKAGVDYILHPIAVADGVYSETAKVVALLHDVLEDTPMPLGKLVDFGLTPTELKALLLVTHDKTVMTYFEYVRTVAESGNEIALEVKLADIYHNLSRGFPGDEGLKKKYAKSLKILEG